MWDALIVIHGYSSFIWKIINLMLTLKRTGIKKKKPKKKVSGTGHVWSPIHIISSANRAQLK